MTDPTTQTTDLLLRMRDGDREAAERLFPLVYDELHAIAQRNFRNQPVSHTLQPTALVHEAFLRLCGPREIEAHDRAHFLAIAATAMRQILIDHARRRAADKRGGDRRRVMIHDDLAGGEDDPVDLLALDDACRKLAEMDERKARVVELRFFAGLGNEQVAEVLGIARSTVAEDWRVARAWLVKELQGEPDA